MVEPRDITREVFRDVHDFIYVFYFLVAIEIGVFFYGFYRLFVKYRQGTKDPVKRTDGIISRLTKPFFGWHSNTLIEKKDKKTYIAHSMVLYGMIILFIGTGILTVETDIVRPLFPQYSFWWGNFYLVYSFIMDAAGVAVLIGLTHLAIRRKNKPLRLDYKRADGREPSQTRRRWVGDDKIFLISLFVINITGFILEGVRIVADLIPDFERVSFLGYISAKLFAVVLSQSAADVLYPWIWWFHMIIVSAWVATIPYTKAMHIVIDYVVIASSDDLAGKRLPRANPDADISGFATINDFSWRDLMSLDACTKCGKCHISCPAQTTGAPLSPRDLILDLRELAASSMNTFEFTNRGTSSTGQELIVLEKNPTILPETIWSCTTCRACVTHCPVAIEHVPLIIQLRRRMVEEGEIDAGIQSVLEKTGKYGNSFGKSNRMRSKWAKKLPFKVKDARKEEVDYLWYVGDFASFDQRVIEDTQTLAKIFDTVGLSFGILYEGEKTAGNDIRRVGEEGLFEMLVEDNLATMEKAKFKKILTTDPHTLNTLRNEYPEFNNDFIDDPYTSISHYTTVLWDLIDSGKIILKKKLSGSVTYHDPCYMSRYAEEFDAPRNIIQALGLELIEMPRCKENSFCCGAGGGMIWMGEEPDTEDRPALNRMREAATLDVSKFVITCPKDKVMFGDAVKIIDGGSKMDVIDLTQLIYQAMDIPEEIPEPKADKKTAKKTVKSVTKSIKKVAKETVKKIEDKTKDVKDTISSESKTSEGKTDEKDNARSS